MIFLPNAVEEGLVVPDRAAETKSELITNQDVPRRLLLVRDGIQAGRVVKPVVGVEVRIAQFLPRAAVVLIGAGASDELDLARSAAVLGIGRRGDHNPLHYS